MITESSSFNPLLGRYSYYIREGDLITEATSFILEMARERCWEEHRRVLNFKVKPSNLTNIKGI